MPSSMVFPWEFIAARLWQPLLLICNLGCMLLCFQELRSQRCQLDICWGPVRQCGKGHAVGAVRLQGAAMTPITLHKKHPLKSNCQKYCGANLRTTVLKEWKQVADEISDNVSAHPEPPESSSPRLSSSCFPS